MTISELAERIEQHIADLQEEIDLLKAVNEALAATSNGLAAAEPRLDWQTAPTQASPRRGRGGAVAKRRRKPAAVLALAHELDAALRNRP